MKKEHAKPTLAARSCPYLGRETACLLAFLVVVGAVFCATLARRPCAVAGEADPAGIERMAAIDVGAAIRVTPEFVIMSRCRADTPQYRILHRKARLRVVAAAQYVARKERYSSVLCSPTSDLPDITDSVMSRLVNPTPDFLPIAQITQRPFTGEVIPLAA